MTEAHATGSARPTFTESHVEADGFRIRYLSAGTGRPLVCLHGGGGLRLSGAHERLAATHRVVAFEIPGFGTSPANERSKTMADLAATMNRAITALGIDKYDLMGTSFGGRLALWMAVLRPETVEAVVLIAPAVIHVGVSPSTAKPEEMPGLLYAHPDRQPKGAPLPPEIDAKQRAMSRRMITGARDPALDERLGSFERPVLALFGTEDRVVPPTSAHLLREAMPNCHVVLIYDVAHAIDAERPEAVASVVADFLERHERFLVQRKSGQLHP